MAFAMQKQGSAATQGPQTSGNLEKLSCYGHLCSAGRICLSCEVRDMVAEVSSPLYLDTQKREYRPSDQGLHACVQGQTCDNGRVARSYSFLLSTWMHKMLRP